MKPKTMPSMREKKRYVTFRLRSAVRPISFADARGAMLNSMLCWMGEEGFSRSRVHMIRNLWHQGSQTGWLACSPDCVDAVKVSMALVHQIGDERVVIRSLRVSGTIRSGKNKLPD